MNFRTLIFLFFLTAFSVNLSLSQNFAVSSLQMPKCYGDCDGKITFTTGAVSGPFSAVVTNSAGCPNSTVQTSNANSITVDNLCGCAGAYSFAIYNASMALVGTMVQNIVNYATSTLAVNVFTVTPATCTNCCDGNITFTVTGGNQMNPPTFSINGTYTNNVNPLYFLCVGTHTVCAEDASGCIACKQFIMPYFGMPMSLNESRTENGLRFGPNPATNELRLFTGLISSGSNCTISDLSGRVLRQKTADPGQEDVLFDLRDLSDGIYIIRVTEGSLPVKQAVFIRHSD